MTTAAEIVELVRPSVQWFVPGEPRAKARARVTRNGTFTPRVTRDAEAQIVAEFWKAFPQHIPWDGDVSLHVEFFRGTRRRVDIDNLLKLVQDALNGVVFVDDSQIVSLSASRRGAVGDEVAGTWIVVEAR